MSQPPPPDAAPPDAAPLASFATELKGAEQCSWLAQLSAKTVYELRAKSLTQANERLDAEARFARRLCLGAAGSDFDQACCC